MKKIFLLICLFAMGIEFNIQASSTPMMTRVYGDYFVPEINQTQPAGAIGTLVPTGIFGTNGSASLAGQLSGGQALSIQALPDGTYLVVLSVSASSSTTVALYNAEGTLQTTTYGSGSGLITFTSANTPRSSMVDTQGRLLVSGGAASGTAGWIDRINQTGTTATPFTTGTSWQYIAGMAEQTSGSIVAVGYNGTNAQIGLYTLAGIVDTTFGTAGLIALDGSGSVLPTVTTGLQGVTVDATNRIYVAFIASSTAHGFTANNAYIARFTAAGVFDTTWGSSGIVALPALNSATSRLRIAKDVTGNFIVAAQVSPNVIVTGVTSSGGSIGGFTNFNTSTINGDTYTITNLMTTSNNKILIFGSDTTSINMAAIRLIGSSGLLDNTTNDSVGDNFNTTGYNIFNISSPNTTSQIQFAALAPDGLLMTVGYQVNAGTTIPYISYIYSDTYASQVAQSPNTTEQGNQSLTFGAANPQTFAGVTSPFNGLYGPSLLQQATSAIEITTTSGSGPAVGDILIGMNGLTNTSASSNMMFSWLTAAGALDTSVGTSSSGSMTLANAVGPNEYLNSLLQGPGGIVYVAGYKSTTLGSASTGAILRSYTTAGTSTWTTGTATNAVSIATALYQGIGIGIQTFTNPSSQRILFFVAQSTTVGQIYGYTTALGTDSTFGVAGSSVILPTAFGLHMGPSYGGLVNSANDIYVAYKDSTTNLVTVAQINPSGTALVTSFGFPLGYVTGLFSGSTTIAANNIRTCFDNNGNIIVAAVNAAGTSLLFTCLDFETGLPVPSFNGGAVLTVPVTGSTALNLKEITGVSNGQVIATFWDNATDDTMYLARVSSTGLLDTTFDSQGSQPGILSMKIGDKVANYNARVLAAGIVQSTSGANQGNIVAAGYESQAATDATPMVFSVYGAPGTTQVPYYPITNTNIPGTVESTEDLNTVFGLPGAGKVLFVYPAGNTYQGMMLVGIDAGSASGSQVVRLDISSNTLDTTFGTTGTPLYEYSTGATFNGISTISIDAQNNILIGGTGSGGAWAQQLSPNGTTSISFTLPVALTSVNVIQQQKSGRYIVAGAGSSLGIVAAFQDKVVSPATTLVVDPTFNPLGVTSAPAGSFYIGTTGLFTVAINTNDTIVTAYKSGSATVISEITADGSGLVLGFGSSGSITNSSINPDSSAVVRVAIDSANNIVVSASTGTGANVKAIRYDANGGTTTPFTGAGVSGGIQTISNLGSSGITLSDLMETTTQQTIFLGYNTGGANGPMFAVRLTSTGALDATWNPSPTGSDTAGVLTFTANPSGSAATIMNGSAIAINGTIIAIAATSATPSASHAILMLIYGDSYITQVPTNPLEASAGTLDSTIPGSTSGALPLATLPVSGSVSGVPQRLYIYNSTINSSPNGAMLIASTDSSHLYVTQLNSDLSLNTNFGSGTGSLTLTPNSGTSPVSVTVTDMYVANGTNDTTQPIYIAGYTTTGGGVNTPFGVQVTFNGSSGTFLSPIPSSFIGTTQITGSIRQTTNGRILMSGYTGTAGAIVAYNSTMTAIDTSFGNHPGTALAGYYTTATNRAIVAMTIDNSDRIYIAYVTSNSNINVQRLLENGTGLDTTFGTAGTFSMAGVGTAFSVTQLRIAIDFTNNQLVVADQSRTTATNFIQVNRYNYATNTATGSITTVTITGAAISLSDLFIDNNQNIYVVGYISAGTGLNNSVVARIKDNGSDTNILLDTAYATTGIANLSEGLMTKVTAGALDPDRRVYLVGSNTAGTLGYMGRFFGDFYWTEIYPAILQALVGTIDLTLNPNFTGGLVLSSQTGWSSLSSYTARAIIENPNGDGSSFIAFGDGTNLIVGKANADLVPLSGSFGSANGLTTALAMATVNSIALDAAGNVIVAGTDAGAQKVVSFTSAGILNATFATPTLASTVGTTVAQQKSGRYIVGGYDGTANGLISAYKNESAISALSLPVDLTFGPAADNGYYPTGVNAQIDDLCIDSNDDIYFVYRSGGTVFLGKLTANGSGLVNSQNSPIAFNSGSVVSTAVTSATQPARIAINSAGNILVGATTSSGAQTALYNGSTGAIIGSLQTVPSTTDNTFILTKLVGSIASTNEFYGSVYKVSTTTAIAFAITSAGAVDTSFGISLNGILSTTVQSPTEIDGISIQFDGKIVMVGKNASTPILLRGYGYPYISQYAQAPDQIAAGILDTTLWPSTGAFALNNTTNGTFNTAITGSTVQRVYESGNGLMTFVADDGTTTFVFQLLKDLTLNTAFNSAGTPGYRTFATSYGGTTGLFVDSLGNIFITGNNGSASWTIGMTSTAANLSPAFSPTAFLATANQVSQQSGGRVIIAGQGSVARGQANTDGYLLGYTNTGALDASFGTGGQVDMTVTTAITDIAIDQFDNIIAVSNNGGSVILQKVTPSGGTITTSLGTAISSITGNVKVAIDSNGYIIVAAVTSSGFSVRSYMNNSTLSNNAGSTISFGAGLTTPVLSNIYTTSSGKIFLVGYDAATTGSTPGYVIVGRLTSGPGTTLTLDTTTFNAAGTSPSGPGYVVASLGLMNVFTDAIIHADDRTMLVGGSTTSANPYMGRIFGDQYYTYVSQSASQGVPGTLDTTFGVNGAFDLSTLSGVTANSMGEAIIALANGGYYMALQNASNTQLIKTVASGALDTSYGGANGIATSTAPLGVNSMLQDGLGKILLVGTTGGAGWVKRYTTAGVADSNFGTSGQIASGTVATVAIEQTLARLVVAGANGSSNGALFAYTSIDPFTVTTGAVDTTFGNGTGSFSTGVANPIYTLIADNYDRLIFASLNAANNAVDLYRLTPTGELDVTFGSGGKVAGVITSANSASQIRVALDLLGNIVVAASVSTPGITIKSYDNGTSQTAGANGALYTNALNISFSAPTLTALVTSADGYVLVLGNQLGGSSATSPTWIARLVSTTPGVSGGTYVLDSTNFNPAGLIFNQSGSTSGGTAGIFEYTSTVGTTSPYNIYNAFTVNASGRLGVLGYEQTGVSTFTPTLLSVYDDPYTTQEAQSPDSKPVGTNDLTLGVSTTSSTNKGILYFGASGSSASNGQIARALALYNNDNLVVAIDGTNPLSAGASDIMMNMFDTDGIVNPNFGTAGSATVLATYQNQYVNDMVTFTTVGGVHKAILAGYVTNTTLGITDSLVLQYVLTPGSQALDTTFGGYNNNPQGIALGDAQKAFVVGQQTLGRVIVGGMDQAGNGLLLGYTTSGNLDASFANNGYLQSANTGTTGIYTHAIDSLNRIIIAYNNGGSVQVTRFLQDGSAVDSSFTISSFISTVSSNSNIKVAVDSSNNVIVAAITNSGNSIAVKNYGTNGTVLYSATFTGTNFGNGSAVYTIARLLIDADGKVIIVASDSNAKNILIARLITSGGAYVVDTLANGSSSPFNGTLGYITYAVAGGTNSQNTTDAIIHPDGRIIVVGSEN